MHSRLTVSAAAVDDESSQDNVARQCCDQDWKQEKSERGNAETLQKLTEVFDMLSHYTIPTALRGWTFNSLMNAPTAGF